MPYSTASTTNLIPPPTKVNDTHKDYSVFIVIVSTGVFACLTVSARLCQKFGSRTSRPGEKTAIASDDHGIMLALILYIGWTVMAAYVSLNCGIGKPLLEMTYNEFRMFFLGCQLSLWIYPALSGAIRVSILLFYRVLFAKADALYRTAIWILLGLQGIYLVVFEVFAGFLCHPIHKAWEPLQRNKHCNNNELYVYLGLSLTGASFVFDIILVFFPIYIVWKLQMPVKKRISVTVIFICVACAPAATGYKLVALVQQMHPDYGQVDLHLLLYQVSTYASPLFDRYSRMFWITSHIEPTAALIGISIPSILKLYTSLSLRFAKVYSRSGSLEGSRPTARSKRSWVYPGDRPESMTENWFRQLRDSELELTPVTSRFSN